jgi:hypothetical protein
LPIFHPRGRSARAAGVRGNPLHEPRSPALGNGYGKAVAVSWYDFESPEGEKFMAKKGVHQHLPLVIWIDGKPTVKVNGKEIEFVGFPTGSGPPSFQGKWTLDDLRAALDQAVLKK